MTTQEPRTLFGLREKMAEIAKDSDGDPESAHSQADEVLIDALRHMASVYPEPARRLWENEIEDLIRSWDRVMKWYA